MNIDQRLLDQLLRHEGYRQHPYKDSVGILTIGIGRNLEDVGISEDEAKYLLRNDVREARDMCRSSFPWFSDLDKVRQDAIVNMCFNLGITRLKGFKNMLSAMEAKDYNEAAHEALDSKWAFQVGKRAQDIAHMIREGLYP